MTIHTPPWCLQWSSDGELTRPDRQDLLLQIAAQEQRLASDFLAQALLAMTAEESRASGMAGKASASC